MVRIRSKILLLLFCASLTSQFIVSFFSEFEPEKDSFVDAGHRKQLQKRSSPDSALDQVQVVDESCRYLSNAIL
jgi:hypothetical protein